MFRNLIALSLLVLLAACASVYEDGKSSADVPANIDVICLKKVFLYGGKADTESNGQNPKRIESMLEEENPSSNDLEVLALAKANIVSQLTNFGYEIVESPKSKADIAMAYSVSYMPERWPLIDRSVVVRGYVYGNNDELIYNLMAVRQNSVGLIGALVGSSRDEMVSDASREAVVKVVSEMRKGSLENRPVSQIKGKKTVVNSSSGE
jgi:putative lipase involved disintegration of autophagic bodies